MQKRNLNIADDDRAIGKRVAAVVEQYSQAMVARKAGVSEPNVHRYRKGTRVPAWFCARLVKHLGVDARWLLCGDNEPQQAVSRYRNSAVAELVEVMQGVRHARSLTLNAAGKAQLSDLRRLSEHVEAGISLQQELTSKLAPTLRNAVQEALNSIATVDEHAARATLDAVEPLVRVCNDPEATALFEQAKGALAMRMGNHDAAVRCLQSALAVRAAFQIPLDDTQVAYLREVAFALGNRGDVARAITLCDLTASLGAPLSADARASITIRRGLLHFLAGDLKTGMAIMQTAAASAHSRERLQATAGLAGLALFAGTRDFDEEILVLRGMKPVHGRDIATSIRCRSALMFALLHGSPEMIRDALTVYKRHGQDREEVHSMMADVARGVLAVEEGGKRDVYGEYLDQHERHYREQHASGVERFESHVRAAMVAAPAKAPELADELAAAAKIRRTLPEGVTAKPFHLLAYAQLTAGFSPPQARRKSSRGTDRASLLKAEADWARAYIDTAIEKGFACMERWKQAHS